MKGIELIDIIQNSIYLQHSDIKETLKELLKRKLINPSALIDACWIKVRDKHYCEKCYHYGDNDELILADGVIIPFYDDDWQ